VIGRHDVFVHLDRHVVEVLGDAKVFEERPATAEGNSSAALRAEMAVQRQEKPH
jgi:hypothetical protein